MKSLRAIMIVFICTLILLSCSGNLSINKAKEVFEKQNLGYKVDTIVLKKMGEGSYIARIHFSKPDGSYNYQEDYLFSKFQDGWKCANTNLSFEDAIKVK